MLSLAILDSQLSGLKASAVELWTQAETIWLSGGWAMIAIAVIAVAMFSIGLNVYLRLSRKGFTKVAEPTWRHWINHPIERRGAVGRLLNFVGGARSLEGLAIAFDHVHANETASFERDLRLMRICVGTAPLVGLLGTVTGMLTTFDALSSGSGGYQTMGMIAGGISEALITTETGLVIALPGLFFQYQLQRKFERYKAFLAHMETVCTQKLFNQVRRQVRQDQAQLQSELQAQHEQQELIHGTV